MGFYDFPDYVTVAEKRERNLKILKKYQQKHPNATPITSTSNKISTSFWGKAWCDNLKYYADYDNRIQRGRAYLKNSAVLDLRISAGLVTGVVCGSYDNTYKIKIKIPLITDDRLTQKIGTNIESLAALADGEFPAALADAFLTRDNGLFPTIDELRLDCSCPDYADMCKHVSAILYAVAVKLDHDPLLLFTLRGVETKTLIQKSVEEKMASLLKNADRLQSSRILKTGDIEKLFNL